ncbi:aminotransferase class I/II-fold pyridoxal phosphate-dependent enzyme [Pseudonocardia parietis]|uniref:Aminotransferase n=1 Tax=Pseudonocardia parietis TaxID=570936 RepID=A0ABS4W503_9PSEU|nr:aminotransferase class I/II-fold pyridoxal phosphate-dependent enzyme [Pseudonocardia parietis]MBP2371230.1 histidinol-phosphate/aromatic aminotransferase/cobyric acid decarboxylase-like protein/choline kinase [Pseudonocardia parietis]
MKALILAAGYGQRMRPLTENRHKTLLTIGGRTIIDRILHGLRLHGITEVFIVTGYRAEELVEHVRDNHPDFAFTFVHNERFDKTNNIFSMALAFEQITFDSDLLLIESDLIYEPAVLDRIMKCSYENVALVDRYRPGMDGTVVALTADNVVSNVIPPSQQPANFDFSDKYKTLNIYKFSRDFCATTLHRLLTTYARLIDDNCYYEMVLGMLVYMQQAEIHGEVIESELWSEVDDPTDLRLAEFKFTPSARYGILESSWGGSWDLGVLDFAFIRNMYFPTPAMFSEMRFHLPELLQNYGSTQTVLNTKLSWALRWPDGRTHLLSGASQCYPWLKTWFAGKKVLTPEPTFGEYTRIFPDADRYADGPGVDWAELERRASAAEVVVFVNPNNPSGTTLDSNCIAEFARSNPDKVVIVDESFIEFSGQQPLAEIVHREDIMNVLIIKSLSKSLGVPGLRLGALLTLDPGLTARIADETPIWSANSMAENFLDIMLKHRPALHQSFRRTVADRDDLSAMLARLPIVEQVFPSGANFVLARLTTSPQVTGELTARLVEKRLIHVKDVSQKFRTGDGYWRVAVRTPADHDRLRDAVSQLAPRQFDHAVPASAATSPGGIIR